MQSIAPAQLRPATSNPFSTPNASVPRLRKASAACRECKRSKARCQIRDGASQCCRCTERRLSCVFDLEEDKRRKLAHKRKIVKLEEKRDDLLQLVEALQNSSDSKAIRVLNLMRKAYADPNIPNSKGVHFYEEAQKLYKKIEGRLDMPSIQGCGVLFVCMAAMGKNRIGWWYLGQIRSMAEQYAKTHLDSPSSPPTRESRAIDNTIWGIYNLTA
ncbi:fungal specific transcription factor domain-containing protein [Aspergillus vadensis CBS 113365]|uniref:Zn(2)-C6 fungal-type domain-containing protein n=1 Tax=Aspergillus vadensis (strain CBS 113365 / IMI 142717 / IBT 24658) TaxID=1448311 RepID=A0A319BE85_ASPVC|nr:hypothetical protein BO88DRAFT_451713 [Aspergillus vadensis CBS 113365]PYH71025.1 hypothetical protein BO88DRAFT_451713 [Aspergillus vadensis CBS 113365]